MTQYCIDTRTARLCMRGVLPDQAHMQGPGRGRDVRRDGAGDQPAAGAGLGVGAAQAPPLRDDLRRAGAAATLQPGTELSFLRHCACMSCLLACMHVLENMLFPFIAAPPWPWLHAAPRSSTLRKLQVRHCWICYFHRHPTCSVSACSVREQVCGGYADALARCAQLLEEHAAVDFVDVNMGCPIDLICNKCAACSLLLPPAACVPWAVQASALTLLWSMQAFLTLHTCLWLSMHGE